MNKILTNCQNLVALIAMIAGLTLAIPPGTLAYDEPGADDTYAEEADVYPQNIVIISHFDETGWINTSYFDGTGFISTSKEPQVLAAGPSGPGYNLWGYKVPLTASYPVTMTVPWPYKVDTSTFSLAFGQDSQKTANALAAINAAATTWNNAAMGISSYGQPVFTNNGIATPYSGSLLAPHGQNTIKFVDDPLTPGAMNYVKVWEPTNTIMEFDIVMSTHYYTYGVLGKRVSKKLVDVQNVMTHELGHALGIGDCMDRKATMYVSTKPGETQKRTLEPGDIAGLAAELEFSK
jgi:hypothetical protein